MTFLLAFVQANPPESLQTDISLSQFLAIQEKGVSAWEFEPELEIARGREIGEGWRSCVVSHRREECSDSKIQQQQQSVAVCKKRG